MNRSARWIDRITDILFYIGLFLIVASYLTTKSTGTWVLTLKVAMERAIRGLSLNFGEAFNGKPAFDMVLNNLFATASLLLLGVLLAVAGGFLKGVLDSNKGRPRNSLFSIGATILPVSLPEILVVVLLQRLAVALSSIGIHVPAGGTSAGLGAYIIPVIAISVLPGCYIARILSTSLDLKYQEDFIKTAYAKGLNSLEVLIRHGIPNGLPILLDSLPALSTIFIGNLMVIEYAFSWPGIARGMLYSFGKGDGNTVFAAIIFLALLWLGLYATLRLTATLYRRKRA